HTLLELAERPDLAAKPYFNSVTGLAVHAKELHEGLHPWLQKHGKWEIYHAAQKRGIPVSPIPSPQEVVEWPHLKERQAFIDVATPGVDRGKFPAPPFRENEKPLWPLRRAPLLGEHTEAVVSGKLGYSNAELKQMRDAGVV